MHGDQVDAERLVGQRLRCRRSRSPSRSGVIEPQAITPKPPALEMAATRWRSRHPGHGAAHDRRSVQPRNSRAAAPQPVEMRARGALARDCHYCGVEAVGGVQARTASSVYSAAISTLTLISEVEITWMLMPFSASVWNIVLGDAGVAAHADADDRDLGDVGIGLQRREAELALALARAPSTARARSALADGEGQVGGVAVGRRRSARSCRR